MKPLNKCRIFIEETTINTRRKTTYYKLKEVVHEIFK